jgi:hypothetical protein
MLDRLFRVIQRVLANSERDRISEKFDLMDERIDDLDRGQVEIKSSLRGIHDVNLANQELFEQKLNNSRAAQDNLREMMILRFSMIEDLIKSLR